ncbi:hypothetical protein [Halalkalibacter hemicellulosilyticus]|uniref:Uncharacterized protein n=1 Tax=Halalkalibacter hemicellulosilyticusJCM 9152 TaxID=1236971 RepID=W4QA85_9BACI|nr:hypothetical protein [Halalkalibacter hemicellulosilyticus]GAE28946.1 hypothetical protein JCM9152_284 [Halalkalibacter hemicellulosilyticusJCM 9152]
MFFNPITIMSICTIIVLITIFITYKHIKKMIEHLHNEITDLKEPFSFVQSEIQKNLQEERRTHVLIMLYRLREAVGKQQEQLHPRYIEQLPTSHGLSEDELSRLFSGEAALIIDQYWSSYRSYVEKYWLTDSRQIKTIFQGKNNDLNTELGQLHFDSKKLVIHFDRMLNKLNSLT